MNRVCARAREMLKPFGKKTNTAKRVLRVLAVSLAACALLFGATSALAEQTVPFSNHIVKTVNPTGTTVNLFDYWVVNGDNDNSANINNDNSNNNTGINKDHQLKFNGGAGTGINKWTGKSTTGGFGRLPFVKNTLVKGYPEIKNGTYQGVNYNDESLDYLFNNDSQANKKQNGKAVYNNVQGLFQLKDGYYVYDSYGSKEGNYAVYNSTTNSFDVYDKAGVYKESVSEENRGQFFPFDSAKKVFTESGKNLSPIGIKDGENDKLNHHFGKSMTTEFVQPNGGKTTNNEDMIFEFSGDDDVWVYIDGVLVGDLGGIHEKATLDINFATGEVKVGHVDGANGAEKEIEKTTIKAKFDTAGADTTNFSGNTFLSSSKHKLSFFYLERGAGASNMSLKFNLTTLPSSEVEKVNQNGEAVQGAKFALYQSDVNWKTQGDPIAQGTTDDKGQLVLLKSDGPVLSFDNQHADGHDYFVLKETGLLEGYRSSLTSSTTATPGELHLQYKQAAASGSGGVVVAPQTTVTMADGTTQWTGSRMWLNGGYLAAKETISLNKETKDNKKNPISSGTTFAVVLKLTGAGEDHTSENAWTPVTGNPLDGYKLCSKHGIEGAVEAAKSADTSVFAVNTKGDYEVTVKSLPGDIETYAAMLTDKSQSEYTVAVYHTTASSLTGATTDNTSMVQYQTTSRQFSTVIHLTNVQNRLFVQKVDDLGKPVNGATFELYQSKDVTGDSPSTYAIKSGAEPYDTVQANGMTYPYDIEGAACFPLDSTKHAPLIKGTYYLRESLSPDGYETNSTITKVIVDDSGVYVDAGKVNDGVRSMSGPGSLIASLAQFGSPDSIDNTLTHIKGKLQSATVDASGSLTWGQECTAEGVTPSLANDLMHMRYDKTAQGTKTVLRYVEDGGERDGQLATIFADTGINRMALYQEDDSAYIDDASKTRTDLGTLQLNHLFTTATAVQYTDRRVARLQVTKTVTAGEGLTAPTKDADGRDLAFTFKFTLPDSEKGYEAHVFDANGKAVGDSFTLKNGYTHSIKAGETIRVYDLKKGDSYSVSELTTKGESASGNVLANIVNTVTGSADESVLPAGFSLVSRKAGGQEQLGTGNTIEGKIVALEDGKIPASNKLEFINKYSAGSVTLEAKDGLSVEKRLEGRRWADGDTFTAKLTANHGAPMPDIAEGGVLTVELTMKAQTATFGDITYKKPGTYTYTISEVIPGSDARADGMSYSAAVYTATVVVEDNHAGALVVTSVKVTQVRDDAGAETNKEVSEKVATFTNHYDEHEKDIIIHAQKNLTDKAGTFPLAQNTFGFTLEGMGGYANANATFSPNTVDTSIKAPMPQGAEGNTASVGNNADGAVTWPAISYTARADAGRAYVYKFAENPGGVAGMTYDGSVYYAVVRNAEKGAGIQTSIEYYKIAKDGPEKLGTDVTPSFTNIYSVKPTSATLQGQKTVSGRDWNQDESYTFNLTAATDDAGVTGLNKTTAQAVADGAVAINANQAVASAPESGRVASFSFGAEATPTVTFNRAGTFNFNITENAAQDGQAGMFMDKHTARATVVVTDLDGSGNHTGELHVSSVTYANTGASDADKAVTDKAAFTNAYHALGTFGGVTVSKTLEGRTSTADQFTFAVTGLWYNGVQTSVDGAEGNLSNKAAGAGVSGAVVSASGEGNLFARKLTEQDLGRTFAYRIRENQPAAAGYTYDTSYTGDAIVLVKVLARKNDPSKLYTVTTVLKGAGVTALLGDTNDASALTDEKIAELKQDSTTYVQQYDASEPGATTPTVSFVNRYAASLDYGVAGGLQIEKTLTYPKDATVFGSPKSTFRYIVKPADKASASKVGISTNGKVFETANVEANDPKTVSLVPAGGLTFTQNDAGKTFTYTVSEIDDKATGYTYDKTVHTVKAVVADNGDGTLRVTTSVSKQVDGKDELEGQWIYPSDATSTGVATVKFKNTYTVAEAATYTPSVTKVVAGANAPDKFTFAMTAADDATKAAISGNLITGSSMSAENGYAEEKQTTAALKDGEHEKIDFSKLTFNKPGTYKFAINEQVPNGLGEWKYDTHTYVLTITVTDEGGKLVARADGTTGSEGFIFTNRYRTSTSYELQGGLEIVKTLNGHDLHAGMFGFTVTGEDTASTEKLKALLRQEDGKLTVTNDEPQTDGTSHTGILGGLTFATGDVGKTFTYKVVENNGKQGGYTYDSSYWTAEIAVKNRDNGSLYTETTVKHFDANNVEDTDDAKTYSSKDGTAKAQMFFTNSYIASGTFEGLAAEKVMDSGDKIKADQYTFDLYAEKVADGSLEKKGEGKTQASESGIATVDFGKVFFKLGDAVSETHEQTIDLARAVNDGIAIKRHNADHTTTYSFNLVAKERLANLPEGVRPVDTSATCRVLLEVTDNNDGTLTPKVTYRDGTENGKIVFHNTRDKVKTISTVAKPNVDIDGQLLSVGDSYVYTINWVNTEADAAGSLVPASVTVNDELPTGVVFEAFEGEYADKGAASGQSLTWDLGKQPAGSHGSVRVRVKITEDAVKDAQGAVGTVENKATVTVDNKSYTGTTTNYVPKKSESDAQDSTGSGVALGDELTYTIGYKNTEGAPATVTITDTVPAGTEFVEFAGDHKDAGSKDNGGNLTWTLADVPAGKEGTVQFKVRVTEDAFKSGGASGDISNQASVAVGNNPAVKTNTTTDQVSDGRLTLSKTVTAAEGITAPNKAFTFKVLLYQADGTTPLAGTFAFAGRPGGTNGTYVSGQIKSGDTIALKAGGSVTVTLPTGTHYEVQELDSKGELMTSEDGFAVVDKANPQKGTVGQATQAGFTNVYSVESTKVENAFKVQKKISGRNWTKVDAFTMTLTAQGEAPMPKGAKEGVSTIELHKDAQVGNFGTIEYTKPGTYTYVVAEQPGDETSLIFSKATYRATVTVTDDGAGKLSPKTKIAQLTDDDGSAAERTVEAAVFTNIAKTGSLTVKKTVVGGDSQREFGFTVALADGDGEPVSGTFGKGEHAVTFADGKATFTLKDGEEKTIAGLPVGARYTVTEDAAEGYTTTVNGADGSKAEGAVTEDGATVAFTNTYGTATEGRDVSTAGLFTKALEGRDWAEGDSFQFALTGEGSAPMPEGSVDGSKTVSVTAAAGTKAGDKVAFDFGSIRYTLNDIKDAEFAEVGGKRVRAKTFTYTVREVRPDDGSAIAGVDYDGHVATMTVTVADGGSGNLTATTPAIAQVSGGDFVNTYTTELDYSARAGVRLSKTLSGRAMEAGQFAFTVTADAETAAKLGLKTGRDAYAVAAADDGKADLMDIIGGVAGGDVKFTDADAGKTYSFTVTETKLGGEGYTNDTAPRTVTIAPGYDAATGRLTVTTTVAKDGVEVARSEVSTADDATETPAPATVAFENSYEATGTLGGEGNVAINATKTLTGRAAAAGEFSFSVRDARGDVVATATNRASGDGEAAGLSFSPIAYTTDALEQMVADGTATRAADGSWAIPYTVSEDGTDRLPAGVTATASSFDITVKVTDDGKGGLDVAVVYPEGSGGTLSFVNGYGTNEATVDLAGTKTLALGQAGLGLTQADIEGKYTFKIEPLDGAPAPVDASGKTVTEATNDAAGNVELGHVTFKQPSDLDDAEIDGQGLRTKTFAYRVSESGSVDGVVNDATATRTFTVRVVEDTAAGTLAAEVLPAEGTPEGKGAFEFTNTYGVNPTPSSVTDQIKVGKKLKGRDLAEGEFEFQLVEIAADGSESVAAAGRNAADGTVALGPVTYTAPGTHSYELREVAGTAGGVTYDRATYRVRTTVTDAGNGMLTVRHELADAEGNPTGDDSVTFTNGYEAAPVTLKLGAAKVLKGAELKAGQFSFELKSRDGKVMSTAKNAADGSVTFDALTFKQAGTYTFTVSEVDDGQAHVAYDKAVRKIVVTVGDEAADGTKTGYLSARVSYEGDANVPPVFTNSYAENPGTPGTPENPGTPGGGSDGGSDSGSGSGSSGDGSKGGMPDTGDRSLPVEALAAMAGIGALTAVGGAVLYRRRR